MEKKNLAQNYAIKFCVKLGKMNHNLGALPL
jgi:hypothetical protein